MVKQGDTVEVGGVKATVQSSWGQGKHIAYHLSDGRIIIDLHLMIESGAACIVPLQRVVKQMPLRVPKKEVDLGEMRRAVDELEE